jgi:ketosteroid isomerase-like protein
MVGYWENDSLVFIGKDGPTYGYSSTLARYRKAYPDAIAMGKLQFNILNIRLLSPEYAFVTGLWSLTRQNGPKSGAFTLLFRKIKGSWVIVNDHSS